jgi:zinc protease
MMEALYEKHPYKRRVRGTAASVARLSRADLQAFHGNWFTPCALTIVVAGDIDPAAVVDLVGSSLDAWTSAPPPSVTVPDAPLPGERRLIAVPMMNKAQTDVAYGFVGLRRTDPDYYAAWVMNNALGHFGLGGRLGESIRERQGMAYYVFSSLDATFGPGPLTIRAGVAPANVERTLASIDVELTRIVVEGLTSTEVAESKQYLAGSIPRQLETNAAIASFLMSAELFGLGLDLDARLPGILAGVTDAQVHAVARRLLHPPTATIAVAGPWRGTTP